MAQSSYRSKTFHIVIEEFDKENSKHISELDLNNYCKAEMRFVFYAFIKHDSDKDLDGNLEHVHYHLVVVCNQAYSKNTIIGSIIMGLMCNRDIVSVRKNKSFVSSIQYLIHKNDKDKFPYPYQDIWSSDYNEVNMCLYENSSSFDLDIEYIINLVEKCKDLSSLYRELGLEKSNRYRALILDLWKEEHPYGC